MKKDIDAVPSLEEVEAEVPDEVLAAVWPGIQGELARRRPTFWLRPTLAAATIVWAVATGLLFSELRRVEAREQVLVQRLAELDVRSAAVERTAGLAGRSPLIRALSRQGSMSVAALRDRLRSLPGNTVVLDASQLEDVLASTASSRPPVWRAALVEYEGGEGIRVRDLLTILESSGVPSNMNIPTLRLIRVLD